MLLRAMVLALGCGLAGNWGAMPVLAEVAAPVVRLSQVLQMADVVDVLRAEGLASGVELAADLPGGADDPQWKVTLDRLYDTAAMQRSFDRAFEVALEGDTDAIAAATNFFGSDLGQRALGLEISARRALMDPATEAAAKAAFAVLETENPGRAKLLRQFVQVNDLIESNVMGSMNSNLAFFRGMAAQGGDAYGMTEQDMLAEVWAGEDQARQDTEDWLYMFLAMAYQPLRDDELQAYIDFSDTRAGRKVNAAMFAAFDVMFAEISSQLGQAVARQMIGQDI